MTLNTKIWLHGPIHGRAAFNRALSAIMCAAGRADEIANAQLREQPAGTAPEWMEQNLITHEHRWPTTPEQLDNYRNDYDEIDTVIGQGLPGIVEAKYREDGSPLATADIIEDEDDEDPYVSIRKSQVQLSWDTAYGYQENGLSCTSLHAKALILLHESLPSGVTLTWQNEYTGEVFDGLDGLTEFLGGGDDAMDWFTNLVKPAMEARYPDIQWSTEKRE